MSFSTLTTQTAAHIAEIAEESCGFITRTVWSQLGRALAVTHGGGVSLWRDGFGGEPDAAFAHTAPVKDVAFSADGKWLAVGSSDTRVYVLDTNQLKVLASYQAQDAVDCVVVSPDNTKIGAGCSSGLLQIFDAATGQYREIFAHDAEISRLRFLASDLLLSGARDGTLKLWNIAETTSLDSVHRMDEAGQKIWAQKIQAQSQALEKEIIRVAPQPIWARDIAVIGNLAAVAWKDGSISLVSLVDQKLNTTGLFAAHEGGADAVSFSSDGSLLASGGRDDSIKLWNVKTGELLATLTSHRKPILTLTFAVNDLFLISGSGDNTLKLWGVDG